jgi:hypothetical protein
LGGLYHTVSLAASSFHVALTLTHCLCGEVAELLRDYLLVAALVYYILMAPTLTWYCRSGSRSRISNVPPLAPQFMRVHGNMSEQYQQSSSSLYAGSQLSGGMRPLGAAGPGVPPLVDSTAFSLFPPAPSGPASVEPEDSRGNQLYAWERDRFAPYPLIPVGSEASWWGSSQQPHGTPDPAAVAAAVSRRLFGQWIGIGGSQPQAAPLPADNRSSDNSPYQQMHIPRM